MNYEITYLLKKEDGAAVREILEKRGANIIDEGSAQKVNLAYLVKGEKAAFLGSFGFTMEPAAVNGLSVELNAKEEILRHIIHLAGRNDDRKTISQKRKPKIFLRPMTVRPRKKEEQILTNEALEKKIEQLTNHTQ